MKYDEKQSNAEQLYERVAQLEEENKTLKKQLEQRPENVLHTKTLNSIFVHGREVVLYMANDGKMSVKAISDSISAYGYSPDEFASGQRSVKDIIYADDVWNVTNYVREHVRRKVEVFGMDYRIVSKSDDVVWVACIFLAEYDQAGEAAYFLVKIKDINHRKLTEMELICAKEKAEESDRLKSAFLANISHEIRTPINGIVGFLNFLAADNLSPKRKTEYINVIKNSSIQLVKLIDDIIDIAKIEAKQMRIHPVPYRINELMVELQLFFETYLETRNNTHVDIVLDDSQFIDSCLSYIDPMRLRQILYNLISNAIKFTNKGYIRFGYRQLDSGMLEFVVEDSGIGLAPDRLDVIFERFRQAETNTGQYYGGTGLGLSIARSLAQLMGGDMRVESIEGTGSTFYFTISYLPVAPEDECLLDEMSAPEQLPEQVFRGKTVLLFESECIKRSYYEKLLATAGISVVQIDCIQRFLEQINMVKQIDAVVADVSIFNDKNHKFIRQIKSIYADLPIILLPSAQKNNYHQLIRRKQCNMTLEEPVYFKNLVEALGKVMQPHKKPVDYQAEDL